VTRRGAEQGEPGKENSMEYPSSYDEDPFAAEFYDHVVPYRDRQDVDFFVEMAQQSEGPVLEIGCGTGRVLIPTARAGIEIMGLDSSLSMLAICREKLGWEPPEVRAKAELVEGDMRQFDLARTFRLVTIPFRPFQHLVSVEGQLACLGAIRQHLVAGGRLVLDLFNPSLPHLADDRLVGDWNREPPFTMPDGRKVLRRIRILARDFFKQTQDVALSYCVSYPDGREERRESRFTMRYLFRYEAEHLLVRAGYEVEDVYADYDRSPFGSKYPGELIFVARRN
jgi:SAM-dependent methyltransferase